MNFSCSWRDSNPQNREVGGLEDRCVYQFRHTSIGNGRGGNRTRNPWM
jgi:hypothetical protein